MTMTYYSATGDIISAAEIKDAVAKGSARIIYSRAYNQTNSSLCLVCDDFDTRGDCYQMLDEQWTSVPTLDEALRVAAGL